MGSKGIIVPLLLYLSLCPIVYSLLPPKFSWKQMDYDWQCEKRQIAIHSGAYIPENCMPVGIARWEHRLFITVPRWKSGVPSSLNYINVDGPSDQPLKPYPSWGDAFVLDKACTINTNSTVVCAFRLHIDKCGRLWVLDTGVTDIAGSPNQITDPAIVIFDLKTDTLIKRFPLDENSIKGPESFFTGLTVEIVADDCSNAYAYIADMGSNSVVVYSLKDNESWRVDHPYFHFDPHAGVYKVGGVDFYWSDGVSALALSAEKPDGNRDLYFYPMSSTKQFKISTKLLRNRSVAQSDLFNGVEILGDRGPKSQSTACDIDLDNNLLFFTQINKNGVGCWNLNAPFTTENNPVIFSDCVNLEFPNDVKVDHDHNLWILSDRMSRFLYTELDKNETNFRIMTAPVDKMVQGTNCEAGDSWEKPVTLAVKKKYSQ